eukprot:GFYU01002411.1.p1 GENE.GFYU01002411.1~~GFYU01002411.1.p1  ORF type:complete len:276 (+),score=76.99 GFYU01002411.1:83-910(+)
MSKNKGIMEAVLKKGPHTKFVDEGIQDKLEAIGDDLCKKANEIVHQTLPKKILALDKLYKTHKVFKRSLDDVSAAGTKAFAESVSLANGSGSSSPKSKKRKLDSLPPKSTDSSIPVDPASAFRSEGPVLESNKHMLELMDVMKAEVLEMVEIIGVVKVWVQLNIPRIEDGNNFGVSIQEETVNELGRAEDSGFTVLDTMTKYNLTRAKIASKVIKYPRIADYVRSLDDLDHKEYTNMRLGCLELRNNYAIIFDMITKNLEKIRVPRRSDHVNNMF